MVLVVLYLSPFAVLALLVLSIMPIGFVPVCVAAASLGVVQMMAWWALN